MPLPKQGSPVAFTSPEDNNSPENSFDSITPIANSDSLTVSSAGNDHDIAMPDFDDACLLALEAAMTRKPDIEVKPPKDFSARVNAGDSAPPEVLETFVGAIATSSAMTSSPNEVISSSKSPVTASRRSKLISPVSSLVPGSAVSRHDYVEDDEVEWDMEDVALFAEELHDSGNHALEEHEVILPS